MTKLFALLGMIVLLVGCGGKKIVARAPATWIPAYQESDQMLNDEFTAGHWSCPTGYIFEGKRYLMGVNNGSAQCTKTAKVQPPQAPVPLHLGPLHQECNSAGDCTMVQNWLTPDDKPVLTPLGCWLAKARVTWIFGDRVSMCPKKNYVPPEAKQ